MFIEDIATVVDNDLPLIRKLTWDFLKKQEYERFSFRELMGVSYEAARQAWGTFKPELGCVFATHCRNRIKHALQDYAAGRDRTVNSIEFRPERYAAAWGEPDAEREGHSKKSRPVVIDRYYENGVLVRVYSPGPYRSECTASQRLGRGHQPARQGHSHPNRSAIR